VGAGGMGVVYRARDARLGREVAIKVLPESFAADSDRLRRFEREARATAALNHSNILAVHDIGEQDGQPFLVMELLEGEPLDALIARGPLPLSDLIELSIQIADALDAAHTAGIVHRDIKPANLFVTRRGQAKVLDFGIATLAADAGAGPSELTQTVPASVRTTPGSAIGTVSYMSPEQARGERIDARSDLFSFGDVLYEMATARQPFPGATTAVVFEGILGKQPRVPSDLNANVPPELERIIGKALEKDRDTRYQTASEMRADLMRFKRETDSGRMGVASHREPVSPAGRSGRRMVLVGAPIVTIAVIGGVLLWQSPRVPALSLRDTVVLSDFGNRTGDAMFDGTLTEALALQLRQSPFMNLLPDQQLHATLRFMGRQPTDPVTPEVAREVCQRSGAKAVLGGTIANLGSQYVLTLRAQNCADGATIADAQVQAVRKEEVITALGKAASTFRERLGESLPSLQRYDQKIEVATTASLEALKAYSQGMATRRTQGDFNSVPFFRRAIELDPSFALAHARLGTVLSNLGESAEGEAAATKAYELRHRVSDRERLYIEARYLTAVSRESMKAIEAYRLLLAAYPDDYAAHVNVGTLYRLRRMSKETLTHLEHAVRLGPGQPLSRVNLGYAYVDENRLEDARREFEEAIKIQDSGLARNGLFMIGILTGDQALAGAQTEALRGHRDERAHAAIRVTAATFKGQMREAERLTDDLFREAQAANRSRAAGEGLLGLAISQAMTGRRDAARALLDRLSRNDMIGDGAADDVVALGALLGDVTLGQPYAERARRFLRQNPDPDPGRTQANENHLRSLLALSAGRLQEAYDTAVEAGKSLDRPFSRFVAGLAALRLRRSDDATKAFKTILADRGKIGLSPMVGASYVLLGRAHAEAGRAAEARQAYEEAFKIWRDADADLPLLVEARNEYAVLTK
jgi:serine/threonine protein kinase/tetratricopeptide (TPR) repeat protein